VHFALQLCKMNVTESTSQTRDRRDNVGSTYGSQLVDFDEGSEASWEDTSTKASTFRPSRYISRPREKAEPIEAQVQSKKAALRLSAPPSGIAERHPRGLDSIAEGKIHCSLLLIFPNGLFLDPEKHRPRTLVRMPKINALTPPRRRCGHDLADDL
jgi:hypothetical protein